MAKAARRRLSEKSTNSPDIRPEVGGILGGLSLNPSVGVSDVYTFPDCWHSKALTKE